MVISHKNEEKEIEKELSLYDKYLDQMKLIEEKTGIAGTCVIGGLILATLFVWIGFFERFITNLVGTVYPAFWTMKSIESKGDDDKQWLTYWVVFACFTTLEMFSGFILRYIPFYFFIKIVFLIWLFMPNSQGCHIIYHLLVVRVFKSFEKNIDTATGRIGEYTQELITQGTNIVEATKKIAVSEIVNAAVNVDANNKKITPFEIREVKEVAKKETSKEIKRELKKNKI